MNIVHCGRYLLSFFLLVPSMMMADDLLLQNDFNAGVGLPWHISESVEENSDFFIVDGVYRVKINLPTPNRWDVQIRHRGLTLQQGHTYTVQFKIKSDKATKVYAKIGQQGDPYKEFWNNGNNPLNLAPGVLQSVNTTFTMNEATDNTVEFAFHLGGDQVSSGSLPITIEFDDIYLSDPQYTKPVIPPPEPLPIVRVNQIGYLPNANKRATVVSSSGSPLDWKLNDASGAVIVTGKSTPKPGIDAASGDAVHIVDFSSVTKTGTGYTLVVNESGKNNISHPFDISETIYSKLRKDAYSYFYQNRSGIAIEAQYIDRPDLARAAGHKPDVAATWPGLGQDNYTLDITGGWYDAGDHGKYVVNGGISVWTMMMQYERALAVNKTAQFADGTLRIPEKSNGVPDILDEARWQLDFMLKMQVPEGHSTSGMVHHKIHDSTWTALGVAPIEDKKTRFLRPVSTAATLNLAATAAQAARIWKTIDPAFSAKCLTAAEKAWVAAVAHPDVYAPLHKTGGGPYNDSYVLDDFYWAACELYVTTGNDVYYTYLKCSPHYLEMPTTLGTGEDKGLTGCFTWGSTQGLGTITLALVKGKLSETEVTKARNAISAAADKWLAIAESEGYLVPIKPGPDGYPWGSNSFVLNELLVMALAREFTSNNKYLNGVAEGLDYLLGRNANDQCYVTGYGERPLLNPHHRFWAFQSNPKYPKPPLGAISGGPNSGLQDPWVQGSGWKGTGPNAIPPAKCFMDHIESWSTNEVTINWNAPLAWVTAYLDENSNYSISSIKHDQSYSVVNSQKFSPVVEIKNNCLAIIPNCKDEVKVSIITINGKTIYSEKLISKSGAATITNNSFMQTAGLYIVNIQSKQGSYQKSIIIR